MKLSAAESKAVKFVLFIIALSAFARWRNQPAPPAVDTSSITPPAQSISRAPQQDGPLDPNTASLAELDRLPGIGKATAEKIVTGRPYQTIHDLARVVGKTRARRLAPRIALPAAPGQDADPMTRVRIRLNQATAEDLQRISGVGPALAQRILARRDSLGSFRNWAAVDSVKGIGAALLKKLKDQSEL